MAPEFAGYLRPDGSAGVRNSVLVLSILGLTGASARRIARQVPGTTLVTLQVGRGQFGEDRAMMRRMLAGLGRNANAAAVLLVGADRLRLDAVAEQIAPTGKPVETVALDDCHEDNLALSERGVRVAAKLVRDASRARRQRLPASLLRLGIECGHTDATSGIAANPIVGRVADRLVDAGGAAVFGETMEWLGAEHVLAARAATPEIGERIVGAVLNRERWAAASGEDLTGNNPGQENIRGGLSSIEEKSLGAIAKGGSRPVQGVVPHAAPLPGPGLWVMEGPSFSPPSITGFVAAGAQMVIFTTGAGNSYSDVLAPTVKVTANPATARRLTSQIDFDASAVLDGTREPEEAAEALFAQLLDHASGTRTWGEVLDEGEYAFARLGADF
ncbi:UxaA family hydrolase [Falsiroseomonas sp.]|uniref:UxaA family hydrolase n=1 Tax=Falsiroseomonas sp. TaxID=2870721 RepID=UPI0035641B6F